MIAVRRIGRRPKSLKTSPGMPGLIDHRKTVIRETLIEAEEGVDIIATSHSNDHHPMTILNTQTEGMIIHIVIRLMTKVISPIVITRKVTSKTATEADLHNQVLMFIRLHKRMVILVVIVVIKIPVVTVTNSALMATKDIGTLKGTLAVAVAITVRGVMMENEGVDIQIGVGVRVKVISQGAKVTSQGVKGTTPGAKVISPGARVTEVDTIAGMVVSGIVVPNIKLTLQREL